MALFGHFPYTNFHELNLDWIIKKIRELTDEWASYQSDWSKWKDDISLAFDDLKNYVNEYFDSLDIKFEIEEIITQMIEDGEFNEIIENILSNRESIHCNMVASLFYDYSATNSFVNGSCYIGENKCALYYSGSTNIGTLRIYDISNWTLLSETDLELYHGNSLTYDPETKLIYAVCLYSVGSATTIIPTIKVVDISDILNPVLIDTLTPTLPEDSTGIYSMVYDPVKKEFLAQCKSGSTGSITIGQNDRIVVYDSTFSEIKRMVFLKNFLYNVGSQGFQSAYNGKLYYNQCSIGFAGNSVFDTTNGNRIAVHTLPTYINGWRYIGEYESQFYNYDTNSWYGVASYLGGGVAGMSGVSIFEMGISKSIPVSTLAPNIYNYSANISISISLNSNMLIPTNINTMPSLLDAINVCKTNNIFGVINTGGNIGSITINGFHGAINGTQANPINFSNLKIYNSHVRFSWCNFGGDVQHVYISGETGCVAIYDSIVNFQALFTGGFTQTKRILMSRSIMLAAEPTWKVRAIDSLITIRSLPSADNYTLSYTGLIPFTTQ